MQLTIPTTEEIRAAVRDELQQFFKYNPIQKLTDDDEIGGIDLAVQITGKAKATIYSLVSTRKIPHSKRGGNLYFSRKELTDWIKGGKRKTQSEISELAENYKGEN